jgi:hypothetical protein
MAERTKLCEERMQLIRRFMGEPEAADVRLPDEPPAPAVERPSKAEKLEQARPTTGRRRPARSPRVPRREEAPAFRGVATRRPALAGSLRSRVELGWPVAAVLLGLLVGFVISRVL